MSDNPTDVEIVTNDCVAVLENGAVSYWSFNGMEKVGPNAEQGDSVIYSNRLTGKSHLCLRANHPLLI